MISLVYSYLTLVEEEFKEKKGIINEELNKKDIINSLIDDTRNLLTPYKEELSNFNEIIMYYSNLVDLLVKTKCDNGRQTIERKGNSSNIKVYVRLRPLLPLLHEKETETFVNVVKNKNVLIKDNFGTTKKYNFDNCFSSTDNQESVFSSFIDIFDNLKRGNDTTIMAYGPTGSGKTYTMIGTPSNKGLCPNLIRELLLNFPVVKDYRIRLSIIEIYNDRFYDLLSNDPNQRVIYNMSDSITYYNAFKTEEIGNIEEFNKFFKIALALRSRATTVLNRNSSRSHCIISLSIYLNNVFRNQLHFIDLAGSERLSLSGSTGDRLLETQYINASLSALGDVISALENQSNYIPYRNSKLTMFLKRSLSLGCHVFLFLMVSPCKSSSSDTFSTLEFGKKVRNIKLTEENFQQEYSKVKSLLQEYKQRTVNYEKLDEKNKSNIHTLEQKLLAYQNSSKIVNKKINATVDDYQEQIDQQREVIDQLESRMNQMSKNENFLKSENERLRQMIKGIKNPQTSERVVVTRQPKPRRNIYESQKASILKPRISYQSTRNRKNRIPNSRYEPKKKIVKFRKPVDSYINSFPLQHSRNPQSQNSRLKALIGRQEKNTPITQLRKRIPKEIEVLRTQLAEIGKAYKPEEVKEQKEVRVYKFIDSGKSDRVKNMRKLIKKSRIYMKTFSQYKKA